MKVSVIIPAYNVENYLCNAVKSVFKTNYPYLEIIIVEDKSQDNTLQISQEIAEKYPEKIRLLQTPGKKNRGAGAARNVGIKNSTGEIIVFLDADDWYYPNRFSTSIPLLSNKNIDGTYERTIVSQLGNDVNDYYGGILEGKQVPLLNQTDLCLAAINCPWHTNSITLKKKVFQQSGLFNEKLILGQDHELWIRIACTSWLVPGNIDEPVSVYRRHDFNRYNDEYHALSTVMILINAIKWMKKNNIEENIVEKYEKCMYGKSFYNIYKEINEKNRNVAAKIALIVASNYPASLLRRRFWGNVRNIVLSA